MAEPIHSFSEVTLLITHYNRSRSLERLLKSFQQLGCAFGDIVVSDDGSKAEHVDYLKTLQSKYSFQLITTEKNRGLGNNNNKGQDAVKTPYTLYVQEDFDPKEKFIVPLKDSLSILKNRPDIDIARYYAYFRYPFLKPFEHGFSEMVFKIWYPGYYKFFQYSDHPHLRRSSFFQKFGRYTEGVDSDTTEYRMCLSFIRNKGKGIYYNEFSSLFDQLNTSDEPSTADFRKEWKTRKNVFIQLLRGIYLQYKFFKFNNTSYAFFASLSLPVLACFSTRFNLASTVSRSFSCNSVSIISLSLTGLTEPST